MRPRDRMTADPGIVDDEPWEISDEPGHVTPVGGWLLVCLVVLAAVAFVVLHR